jgi:hypothetical protein
LINAGQNICSFILTRCDKATEIYYKEKYGMEDFTPLELTGKDSKIDEQEIPRMEPPPHIGIGDEEDTLANWHKLEPTQPKKDQIAMLVKDK